MIQKNSNCLNYVARCDICVPLQSYLILSCKLMCRTSIYCVIQIHVFFSQAFDVVEKSYFETIDDALAEKAHLSNYLPPHSEVLIHTKTHSVWNIGRLRRKFRRGGFDMWYVWWYVLIGPIYVLLDEFLSVSFSRSSLPCLISLQLLSLFCAVSALQRVYSVLICLFTCLNTHFPLYSCLCFAPLPSQFSCP